jgi:ATPase family associated with various cellular activities (AAA)
VLPDGILDTIERHVVSIADHSARLLAAGQHLKRGLLLHGPPVAELARRLQPSLVVLEDVDLIAQDRGHTPMGNPLLFSLLDAMDGLGHDVDVTFGLTTNRARELERALSDRPGRVDLAGPARLLDERRRHAFDLRDHGRQVGDHPTSRPGRGLAGYWSVSGEEPG